MDNLMKKIVIALALTVASIAFADDACQRSCQSAYDQSVLACYKSMQMCMKYSGIAGTERFDICHDDYSMCLDRRISDEKNCLQACEEQN